MEDEVLELNREYYKKFGDFPPALPMMLSPSSDWYIMLITIAIATNEKLTEEVVLDYIRKYKIKYDV